MGIFKKGSKAYSIFGFKCPKCHEGELYPTTTFSFQKSFEMHDRCPHCDHNFNPEPGYYFGAMFISYIITGFFCLFVVGTLILGFKMSIPGAFGILVAICAILFVWIFRVSRSIWLNINFKYDPEKAKSKS